MSDRVEESGEMTWEPLGPGAWIDRSPSQPSPALRRMAERLQRAGHSDAAQRAGQLARRLPEHESRRRFWDAATVRRAWIQAWLEGR